MIVPVPRLGRAVLCLLVVVGLGSSATSWEDHDDALAAHDEIALVAAAPAPAPAPIAIDVPPGASIGRPAIAVPVVAPASARPPLSLAPKTSPPRC